MNRDKYSIVQWEQERRHPIVESYFLKFLVPETGLNVWLRYTITKTPTLAHGALWAVITDKNGQITARQSFPVKDVLFSKSRFFLRVGSAELSAGRAEGGLKDGHEIKWDLGFETPAPFFRHMPADILYKVPFPEVKLVSPYVSTMFYGFLTINGKRVDIQGVPGMVGHNWTKDRFPYEWLWVHCNYFEDSRDAVLEIAASRLRPNLPFMAVGYLRVGGQETLFNSPLSILHNRVHKDGDSIRAILKKGQQRVDVSIRRSDFPPAKLCYVAPDNSVGTCLNASDAGLQVALYNGPVSGQGPYMALRSNACTLESMISGKCNSTLDDRVEGGENED